MTSPRSHNVTSESPSNPSASEERPTPPLPASRPTLKQRTFFALEKPLAAGPVGKALGIGLIVLIVINALLVGLPNMTNPDEYGGALVIFGFVSTIVFGIEYCCRIWIADLVYSGHTPTRARLRYIFSPMGIIDFLAFVPALFIPLLPASSALNDAIRVIRLVRLIKISRYMRGLRTISRVFKTRRQEIVAAFMVLALLAIASSVLMFEVEHDVQPQIFDSVWTGLYWAVTTMTTTGYGDIVPITPLGRLIGFVTMVLSIGVVAIPAGIFSAGFVEEFRNQRLQGKADEDAVDSESREADETMAAKQPATSTHDESLETLTPDDPRSAK